MDIPQLKLQRVKLEKDNLVEECDTYHLFESSERGIDKTILVGRHVQCDLRLDSVDPPNLISRQHAKLTVSSNGKVFVEDLKSKNGTYVNNVMLEPHRPTSLKVEDSVVFGCVAPNTKIVPGTVVMQENAVFKYVLKAEESLASSLPCETNCLMSTPMLKKLMPMETSTPHCAMIVKDGIKSDSGILCKSLTITKNEPDFETPSSTRKQNPISSSLTPKLRVKLSHVGNYMDIGNESNDSGSSTFVEADKYVPLPLTVSNLIAYSGCKFETIDMQSSSDEKENMKKETGTITSNSTLSYHTCLVKKHSKRRRGSSNFTRRKRLRKDPKENEGVCSHFECNLTKRRDKNKLVSWVQCDSCDKWYHTECVGCDYNTVKMISQQFRCGLC